MLKLGTIVTDNATHTKGMLIHMNIQMNGSRFYNFQPCGLNPETGQPNKPFWLVDDRITGGVEVPDPALPLEVLGTEVTDRASGFTGKAVTLVLHISGCVHVGVQPAGRLAKTNAVIEDADFDIRRLEGKAVPKLTEAERERDQDRHPSPAAVEKFRP